MLKWICLVGVILFVVWCSLYQKPIEIDGIVLEKNFTLNGNSDSTVKIQTDNEEKINLSFDTKKASLTIVIGTENFSGKARELDDMIIVGDRLKVKTYDHDGLERDVSKIISISSPSTTISNQ